MALALAGRSIAALAANPCEWSAVPLLCLKLWPSLWNRSAVSERTIGRPIEQTAPQPPTPSPFPLGISSPHDFRPLQSPRLFLKKSAQRSSICEDNTSTRGSCDQSSQFEQLAKKVACSLTSIDLSGIRFAPTVLEFSHVIAIQLISECRPVYLRQCMKLPNCRICEYLNSQCYQSFYHAQRILKKW